MKTRFERSTTRLLAWVALFIILTPTASGVVFLSTTITGVSFLPAQSEAIWEILEHDYVVNGASPRDIKFINATHGWVISQNGSSLGDGIILHTQNGGDSWQLQLANKSQYYHEIMILDERTLWVTGRNGLCHTEDGGLSWNMTYLGDSNDFFYGIYFINRTHGWTASNSYLYKTCDAGLSWDHVDNWTFSDRARNFYFTSANEGWAIGFYGIYHTGDGGDTWEKSFNRGGWSMSFVNENEGWAVGDSMLAHMVDGISWVEQELPQTSPIPLLSPYLTDIFFLDKNNGWIAGDETEVAYTPNGGWDWYSQEFPIDVRVKAVDFINVTHGWAVGSDGNIFRTSHGNSLGKRLWTGMTDPLILTVVGAFVAVVGILSGALIRLRRKRRTAHRLPNLASESPSIE